MNNELEQAYARIAQLRDLLTNMQNTVDAKDGEIKRLHAEIAVQARRIAFFQVRTVIDDEMAENIARAAARSMRERLKEVYRTRQDDFYECADALPLIEEPSP